MPLASSSAKRQTRLEAPFPTPSPKSREMARITKLIFAFFLVKRMEIYQLKVAISSISSYGRKDNSSEPSQVLKTHSLAHRGRKLLIAQ